MKLTKEQRAALKRVYDRQPIMLGNTGALIAHEFDTPMTYHQFRRTVQPGYDCIMVPWCGTWVGIETDGYTHS
jgi:hypothetical protein